MRPTASLILALALALPACDDGGGGKKAEAAKSAAAKDQKEADELEARLAERKAEREAAQKAEKEAEEKRVTAFAKLTVLPDPLPKKSPSCEEVGEAQDAFIRRVGDAKAVEAWDAEGKAKETPMTIVRCTQADSNKVAICQKTALDGAGAEILGHEEALMQKCIEKYGKAGGRPGVVPPKPGR